MTEVGAQRAGGGEEEQREDGDEEREQGVEALGGATRGLMYCLQDGGVDPWSRSFSFLSLQERRRHPFPL